MTAGRKAKLYDLAAALPLIAWYGFSIWRDAPELQLRLQELRGGGFELLAAARIFARLSYMAFAGFLIVLLFARMTPVGRFSTLTPRLTGMLGAFVAVGFLFLPPATLSVVPALAAMILIVAGMGLSIYTLSFLGRSFSIVPEARRLVTGGPYAYIRHPLYAFEELAILGTAMQFAQPWSALLVLLHFGLQLARMRYEEQVLARAFPEYPAYAARTARLVPGLY